MTNEEYAAELRRYKESAKFEMAVDPSAWPHRADHARPRRRGYRITKPLLRCMSLHLGPSATSQNVRARSAVRGRADSFCSLLA